MLMLLNQALSKEIFEIVGSNELMKLHRVFWLIGLS